jgi:hypothetical protein
MEDTQMKYINQINSFYQLLPSNPINANAQCLYFFLLNYNNKLSWVKEFTVANSIVMGYTELSISALQRARNALVQKGYINYKKGISNNAGRYSIVDFEQQSEQHTEQQSEQQSEQQTDNKVNNTPNTLNRLDKTRLDKKEKNIKKEKHGSLENVALTVEEFEKLKAEYPDYEERIERLSLYIGSKGDKYKSHYATIKNWARKDGVTSKPKPKDVFALE